MGFHPSGGAVPSPSVAQLSSLTLSEMMLTLANTEHAKIITGKYFRFKSRLNGIIKISTTSGGSYINLWPGSEYQSPPMPIVTTMTLY